MITPPPEVVVVVATTSAPVLEETEDELELEPPGLEEVPPSSDDVPGGDDVFPGDEVGEVSLLVGVEVVDGFAGVDDVGELDDGVLAGEEVGELRLVGGGFDVGVSDDTVELEVGGGDDVGEEEIGAEEVSELEVFPETMDTRAEGEKEERKTGMKKVTGVSERILHAGVKVHGGDQ